MTRGVIRPTTAGEAAIRALGMVGLCPAPPAGAPRDAPRSPIRYRLAAGHNGGADPLAEHPASWSFGDRVPTCDCTGLVCWALGFDRLQPHAFPHYGGYINTDSALIDAGSSRSFFEPRDGIPVVGDVVIYGGQTRDGKRVKVGHWGIVVLAHRDFEPGNPTRRNFELIRIVDCSSSMSRKTGAAIHERGAGLWAKRGQFLRYVRQA